MLEPIRSLKPYQELLVDMRAGVPLPGLALMRSARLPVCEALRKDLNLPILFLTDRADHALMMFDELSFWAPDVPRFYFPEPNPLFYEQAAWGTLTRKDRLQVLTLLASYHIPGVSRPSAPPIIVAPVRAVMTRTLPRRDFLISSKQLKLGQTIAPETLKRSWVELGYQAADTVLEQGQFSHRGGILDVWPPAEPNPVRMEFFGDEIDTFRAFDPASQRKLRNLESLLVTPAREVLANKTAAQVLPVKEMEEFYLPLVHSMPASLLDYLPAQSLVVVDDLDNLQSLANEIEEQAVKLRADSIGEGTLPADFPVPYLSWSEVQDTLSGRAWLEMGRGTSVEASTLAQQFVPGPRYGGRIKAFMDYMVGAIMPGDSVLVVSRQVSRIRELWQEQAAFNKIDTAPEFMEGTLSDGWVLTREDGSKLHLLTDSEIFGWERPQPRLRSHRAASPPESEYTDFKLGDYVVHVDYGVGRYAGLMRRTMDAVEREYLTIEYDGGDAIFVPVYQADRLSRYVGPERRDARADSAGGQRMGFGQAESARIRSSRWRKNCSSCTQPGRFRRAMPFRRTVSGSRIWKRASHMWKRKINCKRLRRSSGIWNMFARWTGSCAATLDTARPR